jgi:siroheme synthase
VVYMPGDYRKVAECLLSRGLNPATPCAIVSKASSWDEQWYATTLGLLESAPVLPAPCVLIVGETAAGASSSEVPRLYLNSMRLNSPALQTGSVPDSGLSPEM